MKGRSSASDISFAIGPCKLFVIDYIVPKLCW